MQCGALLHCALGKARRGVSDTGVKAKRSSVQRVKTARLGQLPRLKYNDLYQACLRRANHRELKKINDQYLEFSYAVRLKGYFAEPPHRLLLLALIVRLCDPLCWQVAYKRRRAVGCRRGFGGLLITRQ